jgi:transposase
MIEDGEGTVGDGQEEPSGDRHAAQADRPVASTICSHPSESLAKSRTSGPLPRACCTNVVHNRQPDDAQNPYPASVSDDPACCTTVVHNRAGRSPRGTRARTPGVILRGRVFYVRIRVPRSLAETVGRTPYRSRAFPRRATSSRFM